MKFIKKIWKTLTFIGVVVAALVTSSLITYGTGRIFFDEFKSYQNKCPIPPPPGCGWHGYHPLTISEYPFNILIPLFIISFIVFVIIYSILVVKHLIKD